MNWQMSKTNKQTHTSTEMKSALEAGQRRACNVEECMVRGIKYIIGKTNKRALSKVKKKKKEEVIDMNNEHIHKQYT